MRDQYAPDKQRKAYVVDRLGGKITKEEANYRPHDNANTKDTCFECDHYLNTGEQNSACRRVAGVVNAEDTCDLWVARISEGTEQPQMSVDITINKG
jgi:hypothetical protein